MVFHKVKHKIYYLVPSDLKLTVLILIISFIIYALVLLLAMQYLGNLRFTLKYALVSVAWIRERSERNPGSIDSTVKHLKTLDIIFPALHEQVHLCGLHLL